jgi:effector-binding domain-containing protein
MTSRRSRIYGILAVLVIAAACFYIGFVTRTYHFEVSVPYSVLKTGEQFTNPSAIANWYVPFAGTDTGRSAAHRDDPKLLTAGDYGIRLNESTSFSADLETSYKNFTRRFIFTAQPDSVESPGTSRIRLSYSGSLWQHWVDKGDLETNARKSLENLKNYMEDTKQLYGFPIEYTTVTDTSFIFQSAAVPLSQKREGIKKLFEELIAYANAKKAGYNGTRILYTTRYGNDQLMLFASIGIDSMVVPAASEKFQYKKMPAGKNLLAATYQGPFGEVYKAYEALERFKSDHELTSMAIPFQKFLNDGYDFSDSQIVQMKVYYPIF